MENIFSTPYGGGVPAERRTDETPTTEIIIDPLKFFGSLCALLGLAGACVALGFLVSYWASIFLLGITMMVFGAFALARLEKSDLR